MFGEEFDEGGVGFAVVGFGAEIDRVFFGRGGDDFFLGRASFYGDFDVHLRSFRLMS